MNCGAGEGWRKLIGLIVRKIKMYYMESRRRGMSYIQYSG